MRWNRSAHDLGSFDRYFVLRRNYDIPIFHPYFINYGYNKEELLNRLLSQGSFFTEVSYVDFNFSVLTDDFSFDIPHKQSGPFSVLSSRGDLQSRYTEGSSMWYLAHIIRYSYGVKLVYSCL